MAPLVEAGPLRFDVEPHHLRDTPDDALAEPAGDQVIAGTGAQQELTVARHDSARAREPLPSGPDQCPDHRDRRARERAAADADAVAVLDERRRLLQRYDLLAQASVARDGVSAELEIRLGQSAPLRLPSPGELTPASALNSSISASQRGTASSSPAQNLCFRRRS